MSRTFAAAVALLLSLLVSPSRANAQGTETVRYYHTDAIGSVRAITDENGQTIAHYDYLPFGEEYPITADNHVPLQFAGKERDYCHGVGLLRCASLRQPDGALHYSRSQPAN